MSSAANETTRMMLSGNEAVAKAAADAGVAVATAYPGTPSTEILETIGRRAPQIQAQWSPNEKVALEVGTGCAFAGARTLVTMKHVGVNVAADPLFTLSYTGIRGGLVLISADDPGMHSSQNEQDNRNYANHAKIPMLEPADSQEAYHYVREAFDISENFDTPVIVRMTTRVCHGKSVVNVDPPLEIDREYKFEHNQQKYVMVPAYARKRHVMMQQRTKDVRGFGEQSTLTQEYDGADDSVGIVTGGVAFHYAREVMPDAGYLKLGMSWPVPEQRIRDFAKKYKKVYVVEEGDPYLENNLKRMGIEVHTKPEPMYTGELTPDLVRDIFGIEHSRVESPEKIPPRPPVLCPGCPHRSTYTVLRKLKLTVTGDIGCYTLGALPPLSCVDTCVCMGGGVGHAMGMDKVLSREDSKKVVAVIGDSTFVHSGITGLIDIVYNGGKATVLVLDNRTTAMTGRQEHPATGKNLRGEPAPELDIEAICAAVGVPHVTTVDPYELEKAEAAVRAATEFDGPSVVIMRAPCVLIGPKKPVSPMAVNNKDCKSCGLCARTGCPAIFEDGEGFRIDPERCRACGLCYQLCKFGAISPV